MKLAKKEIIEVSGLDWTHDIPITTEDFTDSLAMITEAATQGVELQFHSNPMSFKLGSVVKVGFKKIPENRVYLNSYTILCNASLFKLAETMRKKIKEKLDKDVISSPLIIKQDN